jgi:hypothetical protein
MLRNPTLNIKLMGRSIVKNDINNELNFFASLPTLKYSRRHSSFKKRSMLKNNHNLLLKIGNGKFLYDDLVKLADEKKAKNRRVH